MHVDNKADFCIGVAGYPETFRITIAIIRFKRLKAKLTQALIMWYVFLIMQNTLSLLPKHAKWESWFLSSRN
jgi:hypothetical protein